MNVLDHSVCCFNRLIEDEEADLEKNLLKMEGINGIEEFEGMRADSSLKNFHMDAQQMYFLILKQCLDLYSLTYIYKPTNLLHSTAGHFCFQFFMQYRYSPLESYSH